MKNRGFNLTAARQIVQPQLVAVLEGGAGRIDERRVAAAICPASKKISRIEAVGVYTPAGAGGMSTARPLSAARLASLFSVPHYGGRDVRSLG